MPLEVKLWKLESDRPKLVPPQRLNLERRLEDWICADISLLSDELMVIGKQIRRYGVALDLLAIDREGNLVIVELKRDKTPRDVVAQAVDYASWVQGFGLEDVEQYYAQNHKEGELFAEAFERAFGDSPPEVVNERQRMYIVASSLDAATQRIIEYLSATHGVDINAATFTYFNVDGMEFVGRSMLLDEEDVERRARHASKRAPPRTEDELRAIAEQHRVTDLWDKALNGFGPIAKKSTSRTTLYFSARLEKGYGAIITIYPEQSSVEEGLAVTVVMDHIMQAFGVGNDTIKSACGDPVGRSFGGSYANADNCFYLNRERLESLIGLIAERNGG